MLIDLYLNAYNEKNLIGTLECLTNQPVSHPTRGWLIYSGVTYEIIMPVYNAETGRHALVLLYLFSNVTPEVPREKLSPDQLRLFEYLKPKATKLKPTPLEKIIHDIPKMFFGKTTYPSRWRTLFNGLNEKRYIILTDAVDGTSILEKILP